MHMSNIILTLQPVYLKSNIMGTIIFIIIAVVVVIAIAASKNKQTTTSSSEISKKKNILIQYEETYKHFEKENEKQVKKENVQQYILSEDEQSFLFGDGGEINIAIKGLCHRTEDDISEARRLLYGSVVSLKKESNNPEYPYAVAVYTKSGNHIGYVPKEYAKGFSELIDKGLKLKCMITKRTNNDIPYLYMDVSYKSFRQQQIEQELEQDLINRLTQMGLKETCKLRWQYIYSETKPNINDRTIEIAVSYQNTGFNVKEILESKDGKIKEVEYVYNQNIGRNNKEIAERLEKANNIEEAILKYEYNLNIEECLADSALRLSVLYKKINRHKDIVPMLRTALQKAEKQKCYVDSHKISERLNTFLNSASFMKKYGNEE